ncbi:MAG: cobalamin synthase [Methanocella sp. PtaU1.Bin125]|nr:MAG: cobalamin synthase [Methanocella sp. PtaU1.Bin125]
MGGVRLAGSVVKGFRAALGFLTTIPVRVQADDYDSFVSRLYLFIPVGLVAGLLIGTTGLAFQWILPAPFAAALTVGCIILLTGINHIDGLSDMADGLVTSGPPEKKVRSMKDVHAGAGGILAIGLDLLFLYALLATFAGSGMSLLFPVFLAEVGAKIAMITVIAFGKSLGPGMGATVIAAAKKSHYVAGIAVAWAAIAIATGITIISYDDFPAWRIGLAGLLAALAPLAVADAVRVTAGRNFGGVNGDVMGAANEMARIAVLVVMGAVLWMRW